MNIDYINHMGDDLTTVNAARVSMNKTSSALDERDQRLIRYLANHGHWTPFAHVMIQIRVTAPIFVARQWFRHTVGFARNEVSRRYVDTPPEAWQPTTWRSRPDGSIKQGSGGEHELSQSWQSQYSRHIDRSISLYQHMIANQVAPEQARAVLPQGVETQWVETASLYAYSRLCRERLAPDAQQEIRDLACEVAGICQSVAPYSWYELMNS